MDGERSALAREEAYAAKLRADRRLSDRQHFVARKQHQALPWATGEIRERIIWDSYRNRCSYAAVAETYPTLTPAEVRRILLAALERATRDGRERTLVACAGCGAGTCVVWGARSFSEKPYCLSCGLRFWLPKEGSG